MKKILDRQFQLLNQLLTVLDYIKNYGNVKRDLDTKGTYHLDFVLMLSQDYSVLIIYKLLRGNQDYAFNQLNRVVRQSFTENESKVYFDKLKQANRIYERQRVNDVRNEHVAHLDLDRKSESFEWEEIFQLGKILTELHDNLNRLFHNTTTLWEMGPRTLNTLIDREFFHQGIRKSYFDHKFENHSSIDLETIKEKLKKPGPNK